MNEKMKTPKLFGLMFGVFLIGSLIFYTLTVVFKPDCGFAMLTCFSIPALLTYLWIICFPVLILTIVIVALVVDLKNPAIRKNRVKVLTGGFFLIFTSGILYFLYRFLFSLG